MLVFAVGSTDLKGEKLLFVCCVVTRVDSVDASLGYFWRDKVADLSSRSLIWTEDKKLL